MTLSYDRRIFIVASTIDRTQNATDSEPEYIVSISDSDHAIVDSDASRENRAGWMNSAKPQARVVGILLE